MIHKRMAMGRVEIERRLHGKSVAILYECRYREAQPKTEEKERKKKVECMQNKNSWTWKNETIWTGDGKNV